MHVGTAAVFTTMDWFSLLLHIILQVLSVWFGPIVLSTHLQGDSPSPVCWGLLWDPSRRNMFHPYKLCPQLLSSLFCPRKYVCVCVCVCVHVMHVHTHSPWQVRAALQPSWVIVYGDIWSVTWSDLFDKQIWVHLHPLVVAGLLFMRVGVWGLSI